MTRDEVIKGYLMNSPKVVAEMLYDTISRYENRTCKTCNWCIDEICVNDKSLLCADFVNDYFCCNKWRAKNERDL